MEEGNYHNRPNLGRRRSDRILNKAPFSKFTNTPDNPLDVDSDVEKDETPTSTTTTTVDRQWEKRRKTTPSMEDQKMWHGGQGLGKIKTNSNDDDVQGGCGASMSNWKDKNAEKKGLIDRFDDMILTFTSAKYEAELELTKALEEYPNDHDFDRFKMEFASIFKNTKWDTEEEKHTGSHDDTYDKTTPMTPKGSVPIFNVSSSSERKRTCSGTSSYEHVDTMHQKDGTQMPDKPMTSMGTSSKQIHPTAIVLNVPDDVDPMTTVPHTPRPPPSGSTSRNVHSNQRFGYQHRITTFKAQATAPTEQTTTNIAAAFRHSDLPSFDLGISPEKRAPRDVEEEKRSKSLGKVGEKLQSPYLQQAVTFEVTRDEKRIQDWVLRGIGGERDPIFFTKQGNTITRGQLQTLAGDREVAKAVIDGWVAVLNEQENYRSSNSPKRLFFTSDVALDWKIADPQFNTTTRYDNFLEQISDWKNGDPNMISMRGYDLVFFPVVEPMFYYMVVFNLKRPSVYVIDSEEREGSIEDLYDFQAHALVGMMSRHLLLNKHPNCQHFEGIEPTKSTLRWQTKTNHYDKGVILMHNMETYMGEEDSAWESSLYKESTRQKNLLKNLRTKYVAKLLTSKVNERRDSVRALGSSLDR